MSKQNKRFHRFTSNLVWRRLLLGSAPRSSVLLDVESAPSWSSWTLTENDGFALNISTGSHCISSNKFLDIWGMAVHQYLGLEWGMPGWPVPTSWCSQEGLLLQKSCSGQSRISEMLTADGLGGISSQAIQKTISMEFPGSPNRC